MFAAQVIRIIHMLSILSQTYYLISGSLNKICIKSAIQLKKKGGGFQTSTERARQITVVPAYITCLKEQEVRYFTNLTPPTPRWD